LAHRKGQGPAHRADDGEARKGKAFGKRSSPSSLPNKSSQAPEWKPWADKICVAWQKCAANFVAVGKLLIEARDQLDYGLFLDMIKRELPFGPRTAQRLMAIAENSVISDATHASHLPPSWMTLYELSRLPDAVLRKEINSGGITPAIERKQVVLLQTELKRKNIVESEPDSKIVDLTLKRAGIVKIEPDDGTVQPDLDTSSLAILVTLQAMITDAATMRSKLRKTLARLDQIIADINREEGSADGRAVASDEREYAHGNQVKLIIKTHLALAAVAVRIADRFRSKRERFAVHIAEEEDGR
jgi:DUF3102 family protein